jgi:hypothetical protein
MRQLAYGRTRPRSLRGMGLIGPTDGNFGGDVGGGNLALPGGPIPLNLNVQSLLNRFRISQPPALDPGGEQVVLHPVDGPFPGGVRSSGTPAIATVTSSPVPPPAGSYLQTSNSVTFDGTTLSANCQRIDGTFAFSTLNVTTCAAGADIANINGVLTCNQAAPAPSLPPGVTPIPTNGPLPPGNGWQQVEAPGNPFPYVWIGPGTPPGIPAVNFPSTTAVNVPMPGGGVLNPASFSLPSFSVSSIGSQISNFFSQYGTYLVVGAVVVVGYKFATRGGRR